MSDALIVALNARYIHTNLAARQLKEYCKPFDVSILELTINDAFEAMKQKIFSERAPIVGFSCYIWNMPIILRLCETLKCMDENIKIILGGPEVSYDATLILKQYSYIDAIILSEGERPLLQLLEGKRFEEIESLCYRQIDDIKTNALAAPVNMDELPFCYKGIPESSIVYYESSRGCPFSCAFCLSGGISVRFRNAALTISHLRQFSDMGAKQVKLVDRTFNADKERARQIWSAIIEMETTTNFHFEIAAHLLDEEAIALLQSAPKGRIQLEIGVQSTNTQTLKAIHRPDKTNEIAHAAKALSKNKNIHLHLDLIAGLPNEDINSFENSFNEVYKMGGDMLQLGFLKLLKGSRLRAEAEEFGCKYADFPPYEVLATDSISASELLLLKKCDNALDRFGAESIFFPAVRYLCSQWESPFQFYCGLGEHMEGYNILRPLIGLNCLKEYAAKQTMDDEFFNALLLFCFMKAERRAQLPFGEPNDNQRRKSRMIIAEKAQKLMDIAEGINPARVCATYEFEVDIFALLKGEKIQRRCIVFFDYLKPTAFEI